MSRPERPATAGEVRSQMLVKLSAPVGTLAMNHIDREMIPIIAELLTLGPGNDHHPNVRKLFSWLVDPMTTVEEFNYVIGPLEYHVCDIMEEHFNDYLHDETLGCCIYLGKVALEALAVRCQVLEVPWETAAWFVVRLCSSYLSEYYGFASDRLSTWITNSIGDANICSSSYLRIELLHMFLVMVDINDLNWKHALESVMSACSALNIDHFTGDHSTEFFNMDLEAITHILEIFSSECFGYMLEFDESLAEKLESEVNTRVSIILHDVAYNHSAYPSMFKEPMEFYALTALLKTIAAGIQLEYKRFQNDGLYQGQWINLKDFSHTLQVIFSMFKMSLQANQLLELSSSCIMGLIELVLMVNVVMITDLNEIYMHCMINTDELLEEVLDSPVGRNIISRYHDGRLADLRKKFENISLRYFPMISDLLQDG